MPTTAEPTDHVRKADGLSEVVRVSRAVRKGEAWEPVIGSTLLVAQRLP